MNLIKMKEMNIYQTIIYEYLKQTIKSLDEMERMLVNGMHYYFDRDIVPEKVYNAYLQNSDKKFIEVVFLFSKYILKNGNGRNKNGIKQQ